MSIDYATLWLRALKALNLLKNNISVDIDFNYRLGVSNDNVFYVAVGDEEFSCYVEYTDIYDSLIIKDSNGDVVSDLLLHRVGLITVLWISKYNFTECPSKAFAINLTNMKFIESLKKVL